MGDYREPGLMRFGLAPLYLRYADIWDMVDTLRDVLDNRLWQDVQRARLAVT